MESIMKFWKFFTLSLFFVSAYVSAVDLPTLKSWFVEDLKGKYSPLEVVEVDERSFLIKKNGEERKVFLDNIEIQCRELSDVQCREALTRHVVSLIESVNNAGVDNLKDLIIQIKDAEYLNFVSNQVETLKDGADKKFPYHWSLGADLYAIAFIDGENAVRTMSADSKLFAVKSESELREIAIRQTLAKIAMVKPENEIRPGVFIAEGSNFYLTSYAANFEYWRARAQQLGGGVCMAIPSRGVLVHVAKSNVEAVKFISGFARYSFGSSPYRISPKVYCLENGRWAEG